MLTRILLVTLGVSVTCLRVQQRGADVRFTKDGRVLKATPKSQASEALPPPPWMSALMQKETESTEKTQSDVTQGKSKTEEETSVGAAISSGCQAWASGTGPIYGSGASVGCSAGDLNKVLRFQVRHAYRCFLGGASDDTFGSAFAYPAANAAHGTKVQCLANNPLTWKAVIDPFNAHALPWNLCWGHYWYDPFGLIWGLSCGGGAAANMPASVKVWNGGQHCPANAPNYEWHPHKSNGERYLASEQTPWNSCVIIKFADHNSGPGSYNEVFSRHFKCKCWNGANKCGTMVLSSNTCNNGYPPTWWNEELGKSANSGNPVDCDAFGNNQYVKRNYKQAWGPATCR